MCLGLPGEIVSVNGATAVIQCWGNRKEVHLDTSAETILPGDFVIEHDGSIVRRIPPEDVAETVSLYEIVLGEA
jgi:hydrogenase expression/formation protein HypC